METDRQHEPGVQSDNYSQCDIHNAIFTTARCKSDNSVRYHPINDVQAVLSRPEPNARDAVAVLQIQAICQLEAQTTKAHCLSTIGLHAINL